MSLATRVAVAVGVLLLGGAVAATFVPTSPSGATCGTWVSPEWKDDEVEELLAEYEDLHDQARAAGRDDIADEAEGSAAGVVAAHLACSDALSTRRTVSLVLVGLAVVVPIAVLFVAGGRRKQPQDVG